MITKLCGVLDEIHTKQPARAGVTADELRTRVRPDLPSHLFAQVLDRAVEEGALRVEGDLFARVDFTPYLSPEQTEACEKSLEAITAAGLSPPTLEELVELTALSEDRIEEALKLQIDSGQLIRIGRDLVYDVGRVGADRGRAGLLSSTQLGARSFLMSPTRTVRRSRSKCSESGIVHFRLAPTMALKVGVSMVPSERRCATSRARRSSIAFTS